MREDEVLVDHSEELLRQLYERLGVKVLSVLEAYKQVVLPQFQRLTRQRQMNHLEFLDGHISICEVFRHTQPNQEAEVLVELLKNQCIVYNEQRGQYVKASELYEARPIFEKFRPKEIIPAEYKQVGNLLRRLDMNEVVTERHILQFAREIEREGGASTDVIEKATFVMEELREALKFDLSSLQQLIQTEFLPDEIMPLEKLLNGDRDISLFSPEEATLNTLIWSQRGVICSEMRPLFVDRGMIEALGVQKEATVAEVLAHVQHVVLILHLNDKDVAKEYCKEVTAALQFLKGESKMQSAMNIAFLPVQDEETRDIELIAPENLVNAPFEDIKEVFPYLVDITRLFPEHRRELFDSLPKLSAHSFSYVLNKIAHGAGGECLGPNEKRTAMAALKGLVEKFRERCFNTDPNELYFLGSDWKMHKSPEMILNDLKTNSFESAMEKPYVVPADSKDFTKVVKSFPERLRPTLLSSIATKELKEPLQKSEMTDFEEELLQRLRLRQFGEALTHLCSPTVEAVDNKIKMIQNADIETLQDLTLVHKVKGNVVNESQEDFFYVWSDDSHHVKIYIDERAPVHKLSSHLRDMIKEKFNIAEEGKLHDILNYPEGQISDVADESSPIDSRHKVFIHHINGEKVEKNLHYLLKQTWHQGFREGEFIAVTRETDHVSDEEESYVYGQILRLAEDSGVTAKKTYVVDLGELGQETYTCIDIYKFARDPEETEPNLEILELMHEDTQKFLDDSSDLSPGLVERGVERVERFIVSAEESYSEDSPEYCVITRTITMVEKQYIRKGRAMPSMESARRAVRHNRTLYQERPRPAITMVPNPRKGQLYFRQAEHDLQEAQIGVAHSWICYKSHQVSETRTGDIK